jgi:hypothetical protein
LLKDEIEEETKRKIDEDEEEVEELVLSSYLRLIGTL